MHDIRVLKVEENSENRFHSCQNGARGWPSRWNASALEDLGSEARFSGEGAAARERGGLLPESASQGTNLASAPWQSLKGKERKEEALVQMWEYSDMSRPLRFSFHHFNDFFFNSRNVFMFLHDLKMLLSHEEPWAKTHPKSSGELGLLAEDRSPGSESVVAEPGRAWRAAAWGLQVR